jgi:hypothetical protein
VATAMSTPTDPDKDKGVAILHRAEKKEPPRSWKQWLIGLSWPNILIRSSRHWLFAFRAITQRGY